MYQTFFGLTETPFGITPDTSFFFSFGSHREALNTLMIAAQNGEGFIKITGEVGTGKTLLCRQFLKTLGPEFVSAYIPNPLVEPRTLLLNVAEELGVTPSSGVEQHELLRAINHRLLEYAEQEKRVVLCIDEAQALPIETLEALRLLSNLETEKRKLLQIILFGQPELDRRLARAEIRQLAQRITFHYRLRSLSWEETVFYINHRLRIAGYSELRLFSRTASFALWLGSRGIPRMTNILANKALMLAYGAGRRFVNTRDVLLALKDTESAPLLKVSKKLIAGGALLSVLLIIASQFWLSKIAGG
ncbi:AAA family ATPase [Undibacterium cyanobacteriorum]|uniref:AAA family ATPase n=1 Tax=Undibacterium cyanobacteriorum TaxID=3073561 RepID=A0ABY9RGF4_9BURK|nr:AAA family ATPase [Undibacterium sp. 20NA77.5]WMW79360.1 AAA family ATPase [Undibacterium sp. 20NA77.5]